jgi:predicted site-specific integrase-resolvase
MEMWTVAEAARFLGVSRQRAGAMIRQGQLATSRMANGRIYVDGASLKRLLAKRAAAGRVVEARNGVQGR